MYHDTDRTKFDDRDYSVVCVQCGKTFEATRSDASFCSAKCRVAHGREPQKLDNAVTDLEMVCLRIVSLSERYPRNQRVLEALQSVASAAAAAVRHIEYNQDES